MHCPSLVVKCFFAFHRFLQKGHDFVISFVRIDESAEAYVRFSPEFPVFVGKPVLYWAVFSMGTHFCMKSYVKLHKRCFADTVPPITGHFEPCPDYGSFRGAAHTAVGIPPLNGTGEAFFGGPLQGKAVRVISRTAFWAAPRNSAKRLWRLADAIVRCCL